MSSSDERRNYWPPRRPKQLLACVPVDRSKLPDIPESRAIMVTDLYTLKACSVIGCGDVWIGPRQLEAFNADPDGFVILCFGHAVFLLTNTNGDFIPDEDVVHLGGGYPVEGRARIS